MLCELKEEEQPLALKLRSTPFWVRVYDIPFNLRTKVVAKQIGNVIGEYVEWKNKGEGKWGSFLCMRVLVDMGKPLRRGTMLKSKDDSVLGSSLNLIGFLISATAVAGWGTFSKIVVTKITMKMGTIQT